MIVITSAEDLGRALRKYRKDKGLSQSQVGRKFNMTQKTISNIEAGLPGVQLGTLFRLMAALDLEMHLSPRNQAANDKALW